MQNHPSSIPPPILGRCPPPFSVVHHSAGIQELRRRSPNSPDRNLVRPLLRPSTKGFCAQVALLFPPPSQRIVSLPFLPFIRSLTNSERLTLAQPRRGQFPVSRVRKLVVVIGRRLRRTVGSLTLPVSSLKSPSSFFPSLRLLHRAILFASQSPLGTLFCPPFIESSSCAWSHPTFLFPPLLTSALGLRPWTSFQTLPQEIPFVSL